MVFTNFFMLASLIFTPLFANSNQLPEEMLKHHILECLYVDEEKIILEDGSVWMQKEKVFLNKGDLVDIEGSYSQSNEKEQIECQFIVNEHRFLSVLDSFVEIEKIAVEKSCPFQLKIRVDLKEEVNEGFLGGQLVRTSQNEIILWVGEGLIEKILPKGKEIIIIKSEKEGNKILHTANGEWIHSYHPIGQVKDPMLCKVISVEEDGVVFETITMLEDGMTSREEKRIDFHSEFDSDGFQAILKEIEDCPIESFKINVNSCNPVISEVEATSKEGETIICKIFANNQFRAQLFVKSPNQELDLEVEFLAGSELADIFECGSYSVGDQFLAYPLRFYEIPGAEDFFKNISQMVGKDLDITEIEGLYFLERIGSQLDLK